MIMNESHPSNANADTCEAFNRVASPVLQNLAHSLLYTLPGSYTNDLPKFPLSMLVGLGVTSRTVARERRTVSTSVSARVSM